MAEQDVVLNFNAISNSGMKIIYELSKNRDFLKLSRLMIDDPLSSHVRMEELVADLISEQGRQDGLFVLTPAVDPVALEKRIYINFFPFSPSDRYGVSLSKGVQQTQYTMNIFIPNDYSLIEDSTAWRGIAILHEIAKTLHAKHLTGIGKVAIIDWEQMLVKNNSSFSVITVQIGVNHATVHQAFER